MTEDKARVVAEQAVLAILQLWPHEHAREVSIIKEAILDAVDDAVQAEREECAKVADSFAWADRIKDSMRKTVVAALESVAKAIRARAALQRGKT